MRENRIRVKSYRGITSDQGYNTIKKTNFSIYIFNINFFSYFESMYLVFLTNNFSSATAYTMKIQHWIGICMKVLATKQPQKITFIPQHGVMLEHGSQELYVIQHRQPVEIGLIIKAPKFSNKEQFPAFLCNGLENETTEILNKLVIERIKGYF